ncbi:MAG: OsmC family protein [Candidatus Omnitrophica bacterium]|nr:OsmC family protein [Candidatus Omnitrophota bacterium]
MYNVSIVNSGSSDFQVLSEGQGFKLDTKGSGASPSAAFLASLGACIGVYLRKYFHGAKIESKGFDIKVEADFEKEPRYHFQEINVSIDLKGLELEERRKQALLRFVENCPVHNTIKSNPDVKIKIV